MNKMKEAQSPEKPSSLKVALLFTLCLRVFYSAIGALVTPYLKLDPGLIRSNDFTDNLTPRSAGLAYSLLGVWERFDTLWYLHIAQSGYDRPDAVVFYPLYPLLIRTLTTILWHPLAAALLISTASCFFLFWGFQKLFELDLRRETVQRAMAFYAAWPASFMLFAGYPDSMLTALTIWSVYAARRERWLQAGAFGFLAGLTKAAGALVIVPILVIAWREHKLRLWRAWPAAMCLLGPVAFALYLMLAGLPSTAEAYPKYWRTQVALPWDTLWASLKPFWGGRADGALTPDPLLAFNLLMLLFIFAPAFVKKLREEHRLYALVALILFLMKKSDPLLQSVNRYLLSVFPAFAAWGLLVSNRLALTTIIFVIAIFNIILLLAFFEWALVV
ncbi:MAG TPA: hypothetical protein VJ810_19040 [Blastocatellia bacterium]|nr:hypothetical protein [Blastocatellia bacterium]